MVVNPLNPLAYTYASLNLKSRGSLGRIQIYNGTRDHSEISSATFRLFSPDSVDTLQGMVKSTPWGASE